MNQYRLPRHHAGLGNRAQVILVRSVLAWVLAVSAGPLASRVMAQPARAAAPPAAVGLDSLSDEAVMSELSGMKLDSLLNRMFEIDRVPKEKQESIKSLGALKELAASQSLSEVRRIVLVNRAVEGLNALLPTLHDPSALMLYTFQLISKGIEPDINTLDYWGENPSVQARLKPAAEIVSKMLKQVAEQAGVQQGALEQAGMRTDRDRDRYDALDTLKGQGFYYDLMTTYYRAMAVNTSDGANKAAVAERGRICDAAIAPLKEKYDLPGDEGGGVQPIVHKCIGKLAMAKGDYTTAKAYFGALIAGKTPDGHRIDPAPGVSDVYDARYFSVLCDVLARKPDAAEKGLEDLVAWQKKSLPADAQNRLDATADLLRYRMLSTKADLAKNDAAKDDLNKQADAILTALEKTHPEFTATITEQLVNRLPETADLNDQGVSVLRALIAKGSIEYRKPDTTPVDEKVLNRAVSAARALVGRKEGVTPRELQDTSLLLANFLERQNKPLDAANAYLDFARDFRADPNARAAVDRAVTLAYALFHGQERDDAQVKKLYARALTTAVAVPWSRKDLSFLYAGYLRSTGKPRDAATFYKQVPAGDKMEFPARLAQLSILKQELENPKLPVPERNADIADATALVDLIRKLAPSAAQNETTRMHVAQATLLGAYFALEAKQPAKALQLLADLDTSAASFPAEQAAALIQQITTYRAQAYMADKKFDQATSEVIKLAAKSPESASRLASDLLEQLGKDFDREQANKLTAEMAETSANQARLTDFMVGFCKKSSDPRVQELTPKYELWDAKMKLRAGELATDPAERSRGLNAALSAYAAIKQGHPDDPNAAYGLGMVQFALEQWDQCSATLGTLIYDRKLGNPQAIVSENGEQRLKDNPSYWEARYKWIKANYELSKSRPNDPAMKKYLDGARQSIENDFITYVDATGGDQWAEQFNELRKVISPGFDPHSLMKSPATSPATSPANAAPSSQPVAGK